jgi:hypothetical protein
VCAIVANEAVGMPCDLQMKLAHATSGSSELRHQNYVDAQNSLTESQLKVRSGSLVSCVKDTAEAGSMHSMIVTHNTSWSFAEAYECDNNPSMCSRLMDHA